MDLSQNNRYCKWPEENNWDQITSKQIIEPHQFLLSKGEMHHQPSDDSQLHHPHTLNIKEVISKNGQKLFHPSVFVNCPQIKVIDFILNNLLLCRKVFCAVIKSFKLYSFLLYPWNTIASCSHINAGQGM